MSDAATLESTESAKKTRVMVKLPNRLEWEQFGDEISIGLYVDGEFVSNPFRDEGGNQDVNPEFWGLTSQQAQFVVDLNKELDKAVEDALNEACYRLQNFVGIDAGDYAGVHFSGSERKNRLKAVFAEYIVDDYNFSNN